MDDLQRLSRAAAKSRHADAQADAARGWRNTLIVEVLDRGVESQAAICRAVKLTREQVRRIAEAERKRRPEPQQPETGHGSTTPDDRTVP